MTYLEYTRILFPEDVSDRFVRGCPNAHGLPAVRCSEAFDNCRRCYAMHKVPDIMVAELVDNGVIDEFALYTKAPISDADLLSFLGRNE